MTRTVYLESLGCDKNSVDGEYILGDLLENGFKLTDRSDQADLIIVNTCCFIEDAKRESIETIFDLLDNKSDKAKLIVSGCMAVRYHDELEEEIPEIDGIIHYKETDKILKLFDQEKSGSETQRYIPDKTHAYIKISEGCNKRCTYCAIPGIKGKHVSRDLEEIINEAKAIQKSGINELIIVAQDLTQYGSDLSDDINITALLKKLTDEVDFKWIRLLYLYPEGITDELLELIKERPNILPYFDMPIQHTSDKILRQMGRTITKQEIYDLTEKIRSTLPDAILRSTVIVGFPGEDQEAFNELKEDLQNIRFDRLGAFKYSREEGTPAYSYPDQVSDEIKEERFLAINALQSDIMSEKNADFIDKVTEAIIEEQYDDQVYLGRLYSDAPDIDCEIYIDSTEELPIGEIVPVKVNRIIGNEFLGEISELTK